MQCVLNYGRASSIVNIDGHSMPLSNDQPYAPIGHRDGMTSPFLQDAMMKHRALILCIFFLLTISTMAVADVSTVNTIPASYQTNLANWKTHKFNDNQIKSFVYYWFGLHDKHADINKSYALLSDNHLLMQFPETTVHNNAEYQQWYDNVGTHIKSNQHSVKDIEITMLPNHQYQLKVTVNWQAVDSHDQFINVLATQQWLLVDGASTWHPYVQQYKVMSFVPVK
jgi:uncharacterized membrane protein